MTTVQPTVLDVSRAVARLDANASMGKNDTIHQIDGTWGWTLFDIQRSVASGLAFQWSRHAYGDSIRSRARVTRHDVAVAMASHGATSFTIDLHARAIASLIRGDFSDGSIRD
jgi:hypothetical protein